MKYVPREGNKLPTYWGCVVDNRLRQFRYERPHMPGLMGDIEFMDMKEEGGTGEKLLCRMIRHGLCEKYGYPDIF